MYSSASRAWRDFSAARSAREVAVRSDFSAARASSTGPPRAAYSARALRAVRSARWLERALVGHDGVVLSFGEVVDVVGGACAATRVARAEPVRPHERPATATAWAERGRRSRLSACVAALADAGTRQRPELAQVDRGGLRASARRR